MQVAKTPIYEFYNSLSKKSKRKCAICEVEFKNKALHQGETGFVNVWTEIAVPGSKTKRVRFCGNCYVELRRFANEKEKCAGHK